MWQGKFLLKYMLRMEFRSHHGAQRTVLAPCCRALATRITKLYHGSRRLSTRLGSKTLNTSLGRGGTKIKDPFVGATWLGFHLPAQVPSGVTHLYFPESTVPDKGKFGNKVLCPHSRCFGSYFDVSSVFWLFFQANLILINHPHRPSLAKSEW